LILESDTHSDASDDSYTDAEGVGDCDTIADKDDGVGLEEAQFDEENAEEELEHHDDDEEQEEGENEQSYNEEEQEDKVEEQEVENEHKKTKWKSNW
jgi:hypothetical protein